MSSTSSTTFSTTSRSVSPSPRWFDAWWASFRSALPIVLIVMAYLVLLMVAEIGMLAVHHPNIKLDITSQEANLLLTGFHARENDTRGVYRWSRQHSSIQFADYGSSGVVIMRLGIGPAPPAPLPPQVIIRYGAMASSQQQYTIRTDSHARFYTMLVPSHATERGSLHVHLTSETLVIPPDTREVGVRLESAGLIFPIAMPTPTWHLLVVQTLFIVLWALLLSRLHIAQHTIGAVVLVVVLLLLLLYAWQPMLLSVYVVRLLMASGVLGLLTLVLLPLAERYAIPLAPVVLIRRVWAITLLACMIRLIGSLHPTFAAYDLALNVGRLVKTALGTLVVTNNSIEFRNGVTVYPPGPYILLLPGLLLHIPQYMLVQAGMAMIDGISALFIAALARMLGASHRATLFTGLLYAAMPIHLTALWYGLSAQIFGQALMAPLMMALLIALRHARARAWVGVVVLLSMSLLTHIGVAILAVAWLSVAWLVLRIRATTSMAVWWSFTIKLIISSLIGVALVYSNVALLIVEQAFAVGNKVVTSDYVPAYSLIYRGFRIAFHEMGFVLLLPALIALCRTSLPRGAIDIIVSWLVVVGVFWAIEMTTALQVRYIYFLTPLACIAIAYLLDVLARRGCGRVIAWAVVLLLLFEGSSYWYISTFEGTMMSVSPLLR